MKTFHKVLLTGLLLALGLASCASFSYKYWVFDSIKYDGNLVRKGESVPFTYCSPSPQDKNPCIVMFREDAYRLKGDFQQCQIDLDACQRSR